MTYQEALEKLCKMAESCGIEGFVSVGIDRYRFSSGEIQTEMHGYMDMQTGSTADNIYFRGPTFESVLSKIAEALDLTEAPKVAAEA